MLTLPLCKSEAIRCVTNWSISVSVPGSPRFLTIFRTPIRARSFPSISIPYLKNLIRSFSITRKVDSLLPIPILQNRPIPILEKWISDKPAEGDSWSYLVVVFFLYLRICGLSFYLQYFPYTCFLIILSPPDGFNWTKEKTWRIFGLRWEYVIGEAISLWAFLRDFHLHIRFRRNHEVFTRHATSGTFNHNNMPCAPTVPGKELCKSLSF